MQSGPRITLIPQSKGLYDAIYQGTTVVTGSYTPIFDSCRYLEAQGITGTLQVYGPQRSSLRCTCDIQKGAKLTVEGTQFKPFRDRSQAKPIKLAA
jgi:hypothetical protein